MMASYVGISTRLARFTVAVTICAAAMRRPWAHCCHRSRPSRLARDGSVAATAQRRGGMATRLMLLRQARLSSYQTDIFSHWRVDVRDGLACAGGRLGWSQGATVTLRAVVCVPGDAHSRIGLGVRHATRSSGGWSCIVRSQHSVCDWPWVVVGRENWSNQESLERASNDDSRGEATDGFLNSSVQLKQEAQPARAKGTAKSTSLDIIRRPWRVRCEKVWDGLPSVRARRRARMRES